MDKYEEIDNLFKEVTKLKRCLIEDMDRFKHGREMNVPIGEYEAVIQHFYTSGLDCSIKRESRASENMTVRSRLEQYEENLNWILYRIIEERQYYCCIGRAEQCPGLASHAITNLGHIAMALHAGYIPVVDTVRPDNIFKEISIMTGQNAWELFFQQPFGKRLDEVPEDGRVVYTAGIPQLRPDENIASNEAALDFWRRMARKFMPVSGDILKLADEVAEQLGMKGKRVAGVLCRGTDYVSTRPYQHPAQPEVEEVICKAKEVMEQYDCELCYLATEDESVWQAFRKELGDRLVCSQTIYYEGTEDRMLCDVNAQWNVNVLEKNREYLTALVLLSRCNCFLSGKTSGMVLALLLAENFEYFYTWDHGRYGENDSQTLRLYTL